MKWNDLNIKDKAAVIKEAYKIGLKSLSDIRMAYDAAADVDTPVVPQEQPDKGIVNYSSPDWNNIINMYYRGGDLGHSLAEGDSLSSPDWDPSNPYHYHTDNGEKVVVTPEDWNTYKDDPAFREVRAAIEAEQAAYPGPEYEVNPAFLRDLNSSYASARGSNGMLNYYNYRSQLPEGYTINENGIVFDSNGNAYVQGQYNGGQRFTYDRNNPITFTFNQGKPIEKSVSFYPVNIERVAKAPLPVDRVMNVEEERERAIDNYINNNSITKYRKPYYIGTSTNHPTKREVVIPYLSRPGYNGYVTSRFTYEPEYNELLNTYINKEEISQYLKKFDHHVAKYLIDNLSNKTLIIDNKGKQFKPSRQEAEKKAVIKIGPLEQKIIPEDNVSYRLGMTCTLQPRSFADGGFLNMPYLYPDGGGLNGVKLSTGETVYPTSEYYATDEDNSLHAAKMTLNPVKVTAERPRKASLINSYLPMLNDAQRLTLQQNYIDDNGNITDRGIMFMQDAATKNLTGKSQFMRDVNKSFGTMANFAAAMPLMTSVGSAIGGVTLPALAGTVSSYAVPMSGALLGLAGYDAANNLSTEKTGNTLDYNIARNIVRGNPTEGDIMAASFLNPGWYLGGVVNNGIKLTNDIATNIVRKSPTLAHLKRSWNRPYNNGYPTNYAENVLDAKYPKSEYPDNVHVIENFKVRDKVNAYKYRIKEQLYEDKDKLASYLQQPGKFTQEDIDRINALYKVSPEYVEFLVENPTLEPFAQSTLDSFITRQSRSVRGIHVPESEVNNAFDLVYDKNGKLKSFKDNNFIGLAFDDKGNLTGSQIKPKTAEMIAKEYLTIPPVSGADRLGNAGLYTSNGRFIADKFMRPETAAPETSYIGELRYNFNIDRTKPMEDQLRQYRNSVDNWFDLGISDVEAGMIEAPYTRSTGATSEGIYERSINPNGRNPVVQLEKLHDFGTGNENLHGRWGLQDGDADLDLFIPKKFSQDYRDFIRFARNAKQQSAIEYITENTIRHDARKEILQHVRDREAEYEKLRQRYKENKYKLQQRSLASAGGVAGVGAIYGIVSAVISNRDKHTWWTNHSEELNAIRRKELGPLPPKDASDEEWEAYIEKEFAIIEREYKKYKQSKQK